MLIEYCEVCGAKLTEQEFNAGTAVWVEKIPFCTKCAPAPKPVLPVAVLPRRSGLRPGVPHGPGHSTHAVGHLPSGSAGAHQATPANGVRTPSSGRSTPHRTGSTPPSGVLREGALPRARRSTVAHAGHGAPQATAGRNLLLWVSLGGLAAGVVVGLVIVLVLHLSR